MSKRKAGVLPPQKHGEFAYRAAEVLPRGENDPERSVPVILATDAPVPVFDFSRGAVIDEVLAMDGMELPQQIPLLDTHDRSSARQVVGSIRNLTKAGGRLEGRAFFARSAAATELFELVRDGHVTDLSIGAAVKRVEYLSDGETSRNGGRTYTGPLRLVVSARAKEGSLTAVGADENAKVKELPALRAYLDPYSMMEERQVEKLRDILTERGMPEGEKDIFAWLQRYMEENHQSAEQMKELTEAMRSLSETQKPEETPGKPEESQRSEKPETPEGPTAKDEVTRAMDIYEMCSRHDIEHDQARKWVEEGLGKGDVAEKILTANRSKTGDEPLGSNDTTIRGGESELEKFGRAVSDGLVLRCIQGSGLHPQRAMERAQGKLDYNGHVMHARPDYDAVRRNEDLVQRLEKPAPGYNDFRYASLLDLARAYLERAGHQTRSLPGHEIARRAIRMQDPMVTRSGQAYHSTGSFTNVMLDAANKTLLAAFDEALTTYQVWARQAPSASDFKQLNRVRFGELPDPEVVPENHPYPEKRPSDTKESYRVEKYGEIFSISMEAIVNDDLNAIVRVPAMQGNAMRRKINRVVYSILTSNPTLSDGTALFHATSHGANLDTNTLSTSALNTGYTVMMTQAGLDSTTILNLMPRFLIVPAALAADALQIINSIGDPSVGGDATGHGNVQNIYGPNGPRRLVPVIEGQLDTDSTTAWYLAADTGQVDTIELTFLQGEEAPVLDREDGFEVDAIRYKIRQSFAAKAIDYRGLYQGNT